MFYKLANQKKKKKADNLMLIYISAVLTLPPGLQATPPLKSQTLIMSKALFNEPYLPRVSSTELAGTVF